MRCRERATTGLGGVRPSCMMAGPTPLVGRPSTVGFPMPLRIGGGAGSIGRGRRGSGRRLRGHATQDRTPEGGPNVKSDQPGHLCKHRWCLRHNGLTVTLTLS